MIALLIYCALHHSRMNELAKMAEFHKKFKYVNSDLKPSSRVLHK